MSISTALERVSYGGPAGAILTGQHAQVISEGVSTRQLKADESGALCLFDLAAGVVYTLPTPVQGMYFDFATTVTITSNSAKTITKTIASEFILGTVFGYTTDATEIDGFEANGTNIVAIASNGSTTGGVIGDYYRLTAISTTQWLITGHVFCGTSTPSTPFATS